MNESDAVEEVDRAVKEPEGGQAQGGEQENHQERVHQGGVLGRVAPGPLPIRIQLVPPEPPRRLSF